MHPLLEKYAVLLDDRSGVEAISREMEKLTADIFQTWQDQKSQVQKIAASIRSNPNVLLLGMGASHFVNEVFALQLRKIGKSALAMTASEFLYDPIPLKDATVILTSQSGESVETVKCLSLLTGHPVFGVTLTPDSTIARETDALICAGGTEKAYAGTRSVTLSLAAFAFVAEELGIVNAEAVEQAVRFEPSELALLDHAIWLLFNKTSIISSGRSLFAPIANLFALGCEELGNRAVLSNESGTFRHGPMEVLNPDTVLVLFRQAGALGELNRSFAELRKQSGCSLIVIDSSGLEPLEGALTIPCPAGDDIAAALGTMTTFQLLMIAYACGKNPRAGLPRYGSKVTVTE